VQNQSKGHLKGTSQFAWDHRLKLPKEIFDIYLKRF
jgi:hypothetical protein